MLKKMFQVATMRNNNDELVKNRNMSIVVIPAQAWIHKFQGAIDPRGSEMLAAIYGSINNACRKSMRLT